MSTETKMSAADARKSLKTTRADLNVKILPNVILGGKGATAGEYARVRLIETRRVANPTLNKETGVTEDKAFNVHDVIYLEGSIESMFTGSDKVKAPLLPGTEVSIKGNARLDRGFKLMKAGDEAFVEYLGQVDAGDFRANDYAFDLIAK